MSGSSRRMVMTGFVLALVSMVAPAEARDNSVRFRLGIFTPEGDSEYWRDKEAEFTGEAEDFEDLAGGVDFLFQVHRHAALVLSADHFEGQADQQYRFFEDAFGDAIVHRTTLEVTPLTAGLVLQIAPPRSPVIPYLGAGGGVYLWRLEERGDFIDFGIDPPEIFTGGFEDEGEALGYYLVAGLEVPLGAYWAFVAEGRWDRVEDELSGDFEGLGDLDLSGRRITGGLAWRF